MNNIAYIEIGGVYAGVKKKKKKTTIDRQRHGSKGRVKIENFREIAVCEGILFWFKNRTGAIYVL